MSTRYRADILLAFAKNLFHCARLMRRPWQAYGYLRARHQPEYAQFRYRRIDFGARKEDWVAINEVLVVDEYACIDRLFKAGSRPRVLDLGANIGTFAIRVLSRFPAAQVASLEAAKDTFEVLERNRAANARLEWKVYNNAIWGADETLTLMRRGLSVGHRAVAGSGEEVVQGMALGTLLKNLGWVSADLIKIDIEGGEETVVPAAGENLKRARFVICEIHTDRIDPAPVLATLHGAFSHHRRINGRGSSKPVIIFANEELSFLGPAAV